MGWLRHVFLGLAAAGGVYVVAILALTFPSVQRNAVYAYRVNPTVFQNISDVDQFGFFHHQVQPFTVTTPDNNTLFAWHILPIHLYRKHADELKAQPNFGLKPFAEAQQGLNFRLLFDDPHARVVVSFHGNGGHLASAYRPATFQTVLSVSSAERPVHVISFDYRGFGLSSGTPDEDGIIQDGVTLLSHLTGHDANGAAPIRGPNGVARQALDPMQIVLMGQSMGTFVSSAVLHDWTLRLQRSPFKALLLFASFGNLTKLLETYSIKGITPPILSPLLQYPQVQRWFLRQVVDKWATDQRLTDLVSRPGLRLDMTIMHAKDDWEIPWREGLSNWEAIQAATAGTGKLGSGQEKDITIGAWMSDDRTKRVKWERIQHGGHNRIPTSEQAKAALLDVLDR